MRKFIGKVTLLYVFFLALVVGGCKTSLDKGFAVAVTVKVDSSISDAALATVTRMQVSVTGSETFDHDYAVADELDGRTGKFIYRPAVEQGALTFRVTLFAGTQTVASGQSTVTLVSNKTVETTVVCGVPQIGMGDLAMTGDLKTSDDLAGDLAVTDDLAVDTDMTTPPPDLTTSDFTGVTLDLSASPDLTTPPPDMTVIPDLTVRDLLPQLDMTAPPIVELAYWKISGSVSSSSLGVAMTASGVTATSLTMNGLTTASFADAFMATNWPSGVRDVTKYYEFAVTAPSGKSIEYTTAQWSFYNNFAGTGAWELRSNVDNYSSVLASYSGSVGTGSAGLEQNPDLSALGTRAGTVIFRWYSFNNAGSSDGTQRGFRGAGSFGTGRELRVNGRIR